MSKATPTPLTMPAIARKGDAAPAVSSFDDIPASPKPVSDPLPVPPTAPSARLVSRVQATIAVTVRLDEVRYERMKSWGTSRRITNQEIIVAALDRFFSMNDEEREDGIARARR